MSRTPQEQANLQLVLDMFEQVLVPLDAGAVDRFISPDYIQHHQNVEPGREALKTFLDWAKGQPGDAVQTLHRAFVDGDHVTLHYHVIRHTGDPGFAVIDLFRIEDGMIAEHWDVMQDVNPHRLNPLSPF
ncbi:MAG: nuclear transport factor 2 family protein [Sphingomonadales bacterium]|nr:nuclear transport factor 2 family protein [Sphingomonadales bacterium]MBD3772029.1 nuclear transport factor 2 family protein [Paracoccaceae bacterium]